MNSYQVLYILRPDMEEEARAALIEPVSYTHLDVYKRQAQMPATISFFFAALCLAGVA